MVGILQDDNTLSFLKESDVLKKTDLDQTAKEQRHQM